MVLVQAVEVNQTTIVACAVSHNRENLQLKVVTISRIELSGLSIGFQAGRTPPVSQVK